MSFNRRLLAIEHAVARTAVSHQCGVLIVRPDGSVRTADGRPINPQRGGYLAVPEPSQSVAEWEPAGDDSVVATNS
jgi:hypothetical protein